MNIDDPRLTAYALEDCEHLASEDRDAIEAQLAADPKLTREVDELRQLTTSLRAELKAEKGEALTPSQRTEVLSSVVAGGNVIVSARHRWWRSQMVGLSVAACAMIGLSSAVYYRAEHTRRLEVERERLLTETTVTAGVPVQLGLELMELDAVADLPASPVPQLAAVDPGVLAPNTSDLGAMVLSKPTDDTSDSTTWAAQRGSIRTFDSAAKKSDSVDALSSSSPTAAPAPTGVNGPQPTRAGAAELTERYGNTRLFRGGAFSDGGMAPAQPSTAASEPPPPPAEPAAALEMRVKKNPQPAKPASLAGGVGGTKRGDAVGGRGFSLAYGIEFKTDGLEQQLGDSSGSAPSDGSPVQLQRTLPEYEKAVTDASKLALGTDVKRNASSDRAVLTISPDGTKKQWYKFRGREEELRQRIQERQDGESNTDAYDAIKDNPFLAAVDNPLSTFSIDVDTASYSNVRRFLNSNQRPPKGAVRIEELVNYFRYDYPQPKDRDPFGATLEVATCPWAPEHRLVRVGIKGREIPRSERPPANLVFLVDVSGSMQPQNKLPLVKESLRLLTDQLGPDDSVSIAVYAGASGCVLEPTHDKDKVRTALASLESGGSTNGAAGIQLAYDLAQREFKKGSSNRVILCTDGDFNVGTTDQSQLVSMIEAKAKTGVFLSVLGYGYGNLKDSTLEKLADKGNGTYGYIDTISEGRRLFVEQLAGTLCTIAKDVKIQVEFNPTRVGSYRLIGYENRLLAKEDFNDDTKDAGEIGAGHTVTALYEVAPVGQPAIAFGGVDELKYQQKAKPEAPANPSGSNAELLTVKVRYKQPEGDTSTKVEFPLTDVGTTWEKSTRDFRWAAAVAGFGMMLRESPQKGSLSWSLVEELAAEGRTENGNAERAEFAQLVEKARALSR